MKSTQHFAVSWQAFHDDTRTLSAALKPCGPWQGIVAITRGGLVSAAILAQELDIRHIDTIGIKSYIDIDHRADIELIKALSSEHDGQGFLLVDDLVDTGKTARYVKQILPKATLCAVYAKPEGAALAEHYAVAVPQDTWIDLPWERA